MRFFRPLADSMTYRRLAYLLLGLPLGVFYFTFIVVGLSLAGGLAVVVVGVFVFGLTVMGWRALAGFERGLTRSMLGVEVAPPPAVLTPDQALWEKIKAIATDTATWRSLAWLLLRFPLGIAGFVIAVLALTFTFGLVIAPMVLLASDASTITINGESVESYLWIGPVIGLVLIPVSAWIVSAFGALMGTIAKSLLGPSAAQQQERLVKRTTELEERTALAHELHDSVGHTLTMIVVQAGAGRHVFDRDQDFAREALGQIETAGRRALGELDRILGILREDDAAERAPQAGVTALDALVADMQTLGVDVDLAVEGGTEDLPEAIDLTAYRIVQEALTNLVKHAGPVPATVRVHRAAGALEIEVLNQASTDPVTPVEGAGGRGIEGMRERVAILGGSVEAGPRPDGGWRVWARLPIT
jgi:signal transduction histidine kinase